MFVNVVMSSLACSVANITKSLRSVNDQDYPLYLSEVVMNVPEPSQSKTREY